MRLNVVQSTCKSSMHTQHVKFSTYVAWGSGVGGVVAVGVVFVEGEAAGLDDDAGSVLELVVVVVSFLSSPPFFINTIQRSCLFWSEVEEGDICFSSVSVPCFNMWNSLIKPHRARGKDTNLAPAPDNSRISN